MSKRASSPTSSLVKRARTDEDDPSLQQMIVASAGEGNKGALIQTIQRTSGLASPIMALTGHQGEILDLAFSPDGESLASTSADKTILFWRVYGDCKNYGMIRLPQGAATSLTYLSSEVLVAGTTDHMVVAYNLSTGEVERKFRGHRGIVNSVDVQKGGAGRDLIVSGSDDGTVKVWSLEKKEELEVVELGYPVTSVKWSEDGQQIFIGGVDNDIHVYSLNQATIAYSLRSHTDTICSLALSPLTSQLLSVSMDSSVHLWNVAPFAPSVNTTNPALHPRLIRTFYGAPAGFEGLLRKVSWSRHETRDGRGGSMVAVGGADRALTIWDALTGQILYKLPGHTGTVISTAWSPKEPVVASGGVEGVIYLGEVVQK